MDQVRYQVAVARRRLLMQRFGRIFSWSLFAALCCALLAMLVPKIWAVPFDLETWRVSWFGGALAAAVIVSGLITYFTAPSLNQSAIEIDQRFGLKERLSSSLTLSHEELETEIGQALIRDASRRAEKINVAEKFAHQPRRIGLLPVIPVVFMAVLVFIPDATDSGTVAASVEETDAQKQVKNATDALKKQIALRKKKAEARGLKDAADLFKKIEAELDDISKRSGMSEKKAMIALNNVKKQLEDRRAKMGSNSQLKKQLEGLKNMDRGPADKLAKALEQSEFGKAEQEIKNLIKQMSNGMLSKDQEKQLQKQISQMENALREAVKQHEKKKQELQKKMDQLQKKQQDLQKKMDDLQKKMNNASSPQEKQQLQKQMQQMQKQQQQMQQQQQQMQQQQQQQQMQQQQMQQMQQMAEGLGKAKQALEQGDPASAAESLDELAQKLGDMQNEMDQLESMMDQLSQAKQSMRCKGCNGNGCKQCQGNGMKPGNGFGQGQGKGQGNGLGEGNGFGDRPEEETDTGNYDSQVRAKPKNGRAIAAGDADGPNRKGVTRENIKDVVNSALQDKSDPLEDLPLPRTEREHAQQYFNRLRQGE